MKKFLAMLFCLTFFTIPILKAAENGSIVVNVALETDADGRAARGQLQAKAGVEAVRKYLATLDSSLPEATVAKCCSEASKFIEECELGDNGVQAMKVGNKVQLSGEYTVEVNSAEINQFLKENGVSIQGGKDVLLMEEPPELGSMDNAGPATIAIRDNYTKFQRRIRDSIVAKADKFGVDIKLLADDDEFAEYKTLDGNLVGVFYNSTNKAFEINRKLLDAVKSSKADALVLYYRIDSLAYDVSSGEIRVSVGFNMKLLESGITKAVGVHSFKRTSRATEPAILADDIAGTVTAAIDSLLNSEDVPSKINKLITSIRNEAKQPAGPIKLTINGNAFDAKIRKRALYQIKKGLEGKGHVEKGKVKMNNTTLTAELSAKHKDAQEFYYEVLEGMFQEIGLELEDDKIFFGKGTLTIKP